MVSLCQDGAQFAGYEQCQDSVTIPKPLGSLPNSLFLLSLGGLVIAASFEEEKFSSLPGDSRMSEGKVTKARPLWPLSIVPL
jgi:hypothetical protein